MSTLPICAILDDYQNAALGVADWSALDGRVARRRFDRHLGGETEAAQALAGARIVIAMRERTSFPESLFARLPDLRHFVTTGGRNRSIGLDAARAHGVTVTCTLAAGNPAAELALAGLLAAMRDLPSKVQNLRANGPWQTGLGRSVAGKRLGILGLGKLGARCARIGQAFGMDVYDTEPLPPDHLFRRLPDVLATPHIGYVTEENYRVYYADAVENVCAGLDGSPVRVLA